MSRLLAWIVPTVPIYAFDSCTATLYVWATVIDDSQQWLR